MSVFDEVKARISCSDAATAYGFTPNLAGYIRCPFHNDTTPSLKLYPGAGGFYCFGCGAHGTVIDFVARLYDVSAIAAVRRLNNDFHLALQLDEPEDPEERRRRQDQEELTRLEFEGWRRRKLTQLNDAYLTGFRALRDKHPSTWTDAETLAIKMLPALEYCANVLDGRDRDQQMHLFEAERSLPGYGS